MDVSNINSEEIDFIKVNPQLAHKFLNILKREFPNKSIINEKYKVIKVKNSILFPIVEDKFLKENLKNLIFEELPFEIISRKGINNPQFKYKTIDNALEGQIPEKYSSLVPSSYDIIGEIAIIEFDEVPELGLEEYNIFKKKIAEAIIHVNKAVKCVYEKGSKIRGDFRTRTLKHLFGERIKETIHKENGCIFKIDIAKTFFTPRLVYERNRISNLNFQEKEIIFDLFAGVGPFSIQIARKHNVLIHAFDINPEAYFYLKENIKINTLRGEVFPYNFDIAELRNNQNECIKKFKHSADRIIMNLPEKSLEYLDIACLLMKKSGAILHIYQFCEVPNAIKKAITKVNNQLVKIEPNWKIWKILHTRSVKSHSPQKDMIVLDCQMKYCLNQ